MISKDFKKLAAILLLLGVLLATSPGLALADASSPYVGEIVLFAGNFAPVGWAICDGSLLPIAEYDVLFSLIGTTYGGDGVNTFALPDLRGRVPVGMGAGPGLSPRIIGEAGGAESVTLTVNQLPVHPLTVASTNPGDTNTPGPNVYPARAMLDRQDVNIYSNSSVNQVSTAAAGGSQPHENMMPYCTINYIISLYGIYPAMN